MITLKLKSLDKQSLTKYYLFIKKITSILKINFIKVINLPTKQKRIALLKSPHVNKKAQQHFDLTIFKKFIYFKDLNKKHLTLLLLNKPKHIKLEIKKE